MIFLVNSLQKRHDQHFQKESLEEATTNSEHINSQNLTFQGKGVNKIANYFENKDADKRNLNNDTNVQTSGTSTLASGSVETVNSLDPSLQHIKVENDGGTVALIFSSLAFIAVLVIVASAVSYNRYVGYKTYRYPKPYKKDPINQSMFYSEISLNTAPNEFETIIDQFLSSYEEVYIPTKSRYSIKSTSEISEIELSSEELFLSSQISKGLQIYLDSASKKSIKIQF